MYIKDQFIWGIANDVLQADMFAQAMSMKALEQNINCTEAFETAIQDQNKISSILNIVRL